MSLHGIEKLNPTAALKYQLARENVENYEALLKIKKDNHRNTEKNMFGVDYDLNYTTCEEDLISHKIELFESYSKQLQKERFQELVDLNLQKELLNIKNLILLRCEKKNQPLTQNIIDLIKSEQELAVSSKNPISLKRRQANLEKIKPYFKAFFMNAVYTKTYQSAEDYERNEEIKSYELPDDIDRKNVPDRVIFNKGLLISKKDFEEIIKDTCIALELNYAVKGQQSFNKNKVFDLIDISPDLFKELNYKTDLINRLKSTNFAMIVLDNVDSFDWSAEDYQKLLEVKTIIQSRTMTPCAIFAISNKRNPLIDNLQDLYLLDYEELYQPEKKQELSKPALMKFLSLIGIHYESQEYKELVQIDNEKKN